jgi:hypothetical protein
MTLHRPPSLVPNAISRPPAVLQPALGRTAAAGLGRVLYTLLGVGAAYVALLVCGVAAAHSAIALSPAFGGTGRDVRFMTATPLAPVVESETTESIAVTHAILLATVNPELDDTHYFFEYGPTTAYGTQIPLAPGTDIGESESGQGVSAELRGLAASTTYHFRVVATNSIGTTDGQDMTFMTTPRAPIVESETTANIIATQATLQATVNPELDDTNYFFEYGPTTAYGTQVPLAPGTDIGESESGQGVSAELAGLAASTTYHFRVVATNSIGTTDGQDMTFTTATPLEPVVESETTADITPAKATLQATVNPEFADTHYFFEYGPTTAYGTKIPPVPGTDIGESSSGQGASAELPGLAASTTYHYRVVATNSIGTTYGQDMTFTTAPPAVIASEFATNVTATAADLMTEIDPEDIETKYSFEYGTSPSYGTSVPVHGGELAAVETAQRATVHVEGLEPSTKYYFRVVAINTYGTVTGSAQTFTTYPAGEPSLPDNRVYELVSPLETNDGDVGGNDVNSILEAGHAESSVSGSAVTYASWGSFHHAQSAGITTQYLSWRGPSGWSTQALPPPLPVTGKVHLVTLDPYYVFTPELTAGVLEWLGSLATGEPLEYGNFYVQEKIGTPEIGAPTYQLVTTATPANLSGYEVKFGGASPDLNHVIFEANRGLVEGAPAEGQSVYEWAGGSLRLVSVLPGPGNVAAPAGAGAGDGEDRLFANDVSADGSRIIWTDSEQLYVREDGVRTVMLNASQRTPSLGDGDATFRAATPDGSKVFFTDETQLTNDPDDNGGLYEYDFDTGALTDLSPDGSGSPGVEGVVGGSEDGSNVYFVASASLAAGAGAGKNNLYLSHDGAITFIAALSNEDSADWTETLENRTARVTPDGEHLVFMSQEPLTGYDNIDADTGKADTEVFVYDATGGLSCASCNPSGERPVGPSKVPTGQNRNYIPRYISDDGQRVFFDSSDALVPQASNGKQNVYEYENGTVYLLSAGTSEDISTFSDASPDGDDAFFATRAHLVPEDENANAHLYDARVDGGFPAGALPPAPCSGEGCRGSLSAPPALLGVATETDGGAESPVAQPEPAAKPKKHALKPKPRTQRSARKSKARKPGRKSKARRPGRQRAGRSARKSGRPRRAAG